MNLLYRSLLGRVWPARCPVFVLTGLHLAEKPRPNLKCVILAVHWMAWTDWILCLDGMCDLSSTLDGLVGLLTYTELTRSFV